MDNEYAGISTGSSASTKSKSIEDMVRLKHEILMKLDKCYDKLTSDVTDLKGSMHGVEVCTEEIRAVSHANNENKLAVKELEGKITKLETEITLL